MRARGGPVLARLVTILGLVLWLVGCDDGAAGSASGRDAAGGAPTDAGGAEDDAANDDGDVPGDGAAPRPRDASTDDAAGSGPIRRDGAVTFPPDAAELADAAARDSAVAPRPDAAPRGDAHVSPPIDMALPPEADGSHDASVQAPDAAEPTDAAPTAPDGAVDAAALDAAVVRDAAVEAPDAVEGPDAAVARDAAVEAPDAAATPDAAVEPPGCSPNVAAPWIRNPVHAGGTVVFNELLVDPGDADDPEFVELHNLMTVDVDLSGWTLEGGIDYRFPPGTLLRGRELLVVASDPPRLGFDGVLGPWDGRLAASGERLDLRSAGGRLMDSIEYDDAFPWPRPVVAGASLAKRAPVAPSALAESWVSSPARGGTPGAPNVPVRDASPSRTLVPLDAEWRFAIPDPVARPAGWMAPDFDDGTWESAPAAFYSGESAGAEVTARVTADNFFAVYAGDARGEALRLIGRDAPGDWTSAEDFVVDLGPGDHLYFAAWEDPGNDGGPQMLIAQVTLPDGEVVGTHPTTTEVVLGPAGASPGGAPLDPAPAVADVASLVRAAELGDAWGPPPVSADRAAGPWGGALAAAFAPAAHYVWIDTFDSVSATNAQNTYALFRTRAPPLPTGGDTELPPGPVTTWFRTEFEFDGDPAATWLTLEARVDDGFVAWLNGVEVYRQNMPAGPSDPETLALAPVERPELRGAPIDSDLLLPGRNVLAVEVHQVAPGDPDLQFAAALHALTRPAAVAAEAPSEAEVVIHEVMYHPTPDGPGEWVELYNRGEAPIDLGGWQLVDAVGFRFPEGTVLAPDGYLVVARDAAAFRAAFPDVPVLGDFEGGLDDGGDRLRLLDACGGLVDDVRYHDAGRWPADADGDGPSLELRDPRADNAAPEAWAASDEGRHAAWQEVRYRGVAGPSAVGPDGRWEELVVGLLDAGEVLIDDLRVIEDPAGAAVDLLRNGTFDDGVAGWRLLGNHRRGAVVPDPDDPDNPVLRLVASGATEHMHNHAETTLIDGRRVTNGTEYEIAYRARWVAGSNQLNTRLYFNRLPRTTRLARPPSRGTPGAPNSTRVANLGPTWAGFGHAPAVPAPGQPVVVSANAHDPDGVDAATLWTSVGGAPFEPTAMVESPGGRFDALLPGWPAGTLVQLYVEGVDGHGASSFFPARGPESRALLQVDDARAAGAPAALRRMRLLMAPGDVADFHADVNVMSNELVGATVVYDEREVFYDVGVRAKGSERGRPVTARLGFALRFDPAHLFRGAYESLAIDRSEGVRFGQRELLLDQVIQRSNAVSAEFNDLVHLVSPRPEHTGAASLQLTRTGDELLENQFPDGGDGMMYEYELVYFPTTTDDGTPQGRKRPQPDGVVGTALRDLGDDPENYRHVFILKNNRDLDDYDGLIRFAKTFGLAEPAFGQQVGEVIDVDQWLHAFALSALSGAVDHYGSGAQHNGRFYIRPSDHRALFFPHDLDFYPADPRQALVANNDLRRLLALPGNTRVFYGHLYDIVTGAADPAELARWRDHFAALLSGQDFAGHHAFLAQRVDWILNSAPDAIRTRFPPIDFAITTNGGADLEVDAEVIALEGPAWIDVREIRYAGERRALEVVWSDERTWRIEVPLAPGLNLVDLEAVDRRGQIVGADAIAITRR